MKTQQIFPSPASSVHLPGPLFLIVLLMCSLLPARFANAQYRAGLQGTVTDSSGAVIPDASVTIVDKETNQSQTVKTDGAGTYTFNRLAPAPYTVTVEAPGFAKRIIDDVSYLRRENAGAQCHPRRGRPDRNPSPSPTPPPQSTLPPRPSPQRSPHRTSGAPLVQSRSLPIATPHTRCIG